MTTAAQRAHIDKASMKANQTNLWIARRNLHQYLTRLTEDGYDINNLPKGKKISKTRLENKIRRIEEGMVQR